MAMILLYKESRKRSSGENTYMTVQSGSEDLNSSDDVYSSVPDSGNHIQTLDERGFHNRRKDKLGPLPAVPNIRSKDRNNNSNHNKQDINTADDGNNNVTNDREISNVKQGSKDNFLIMRRRISLYLVLFKRKYFFSFKILWFYL